MAAPSFLGLPTELRLRIYEYVFAADINARVIENIQHSSGSNGTQALMIPNETMALQNSIPWLRLPLVCRQIYEELQSGILNRKRDRTYIADLEVCNDPSSKVIRSVTWKRIPCTPAEAQHLIINVVTRSGPGPWTEGGPASLARAIYQLLNHTVHLGPRIFRHSLLPEHMSLLDLTINIDIGQNSTPPAIGCNSNVRFNWSLFHGGWQQISRTGFLTGFVDFTSLRSTDGEEHVVPSEYQKVPALPGFWRGYGFQWVSTNIESCPTC
jgi:hypothetical protein